MEVAMPMLCEMSEIAIVPVQRAINTLHDKFFCKLEIYGRRTSMPWMQCLLCFSCFFASWDFKCIHDMNSMQMRVTQFKIN